MNLKEAVHMATSAAPNKSTLPILTNAAIKANNGTFEITCTDLEVGVRATADYNAGQFSCCVDAKRLAAAINLTDKPSFKIIGSQLTIKQGAMRFAIPCLPFDAHPGLTKLSDPDAVELDGGILQMIGDVRYASDKQNPRPFLNGITIRGENGKLSVIASDGCRLSARFGQTTHDFNVIIPINSANFIIKTKPDRVFAGKEIYCTKPGLEILCKPIEGKMPDILSRFSKPDSTFTVSRENIESTVLALNTLKNSAMTTIALLEWKEGELNVSSIGGDKSTVENSMPASFERNGQTGVNITYLSDLVNAIKGESIEFECAGIPKMPLIVRTSNSIDMIMPTNF